MSLFVRLLDEIEDADRPISAVLLKARRIADELPGRKLKSWVLLEMNGYRDTNAAVPDYRKIGIQCTGTFVGHYRITDFPLPLDSFGTEVEDILNHHVFLDGVGALEGFARSSRENLASPVPPKLISYFQSARVPGTPAGCVLVEAYKQIPTVAIRGVLYAVRTRLLEFLLRLGKDFPDLKADDGDAALGRVPETRVETLVQSIIIEGDNAEVNICLSKQQVHVEGDISVGGAFVVADKLRDSFKGGRAG